MSVLLSTVVVVVGLSTLGGASRSFSAARSAFLNTAERAGLDSWRNKDRPSAVTIPACGCVPDGGVADLSSRSRRSSYVTYEDTRKLEEGSGRGVEDGGQGG